MKNRQRAESERTHPPNVPRDTAEATQRSGEWEDGGPGPNPDKSSCLELNTITVEKKGPELSTKSRLVNFLPPPTPSWCYKPDPADQQAGLEHSGQ